MFIYVCMYVCIHMYVCMYACVYKFHSLKAMQDFHLCMYVCMCVCIYMFPQGGIPTVSFIGSGPKFDRPSTKKGIFLQARMNDTDFLQMEKGRYESSHFLWKYNSNQSLCVKLCFILCFTGS